MTPRRWLALGALLFAIGLAVSALLYRRSRSADSDANARVVAALGRARHLDRLQSQEVLEARFGLLNQYDSINATGNDLDAADRELADAIRASVGPMAALERVETSLATKRSRIESFKAENALLRNSTYYLPTAASDVATKLAAAGVPASAIGPVQHIVQTGLAYDLIGDESARLAHERALVDLRALASPVPLGVLISHGEVIAREVPAVDVRVAEIVSNETSDALDDVERLYESRFAAEVATSNFYRKILYGWSLALLLAIGLTGMQMRRLDRALGELEAEMKLARKIQSALVPESPALDGCEVAAHMTPTEEVGGDYYDVVRAGDAEWILIGDVSGHGVSAGLVMMMCHTAVRAVLASEPDAGPARLLALVNGVLTHAVAQLGEEKHMTMSAFRRSGGVVRFAGAHQDVHVYRAASASVEAIETRGMWLCIKANIADDLPEQELELGIGDVLLLHTDGITEAMRDGALFDDRNLVRALADAGEKPASDILAAIYAALDGWKVSDDATVIVVKQITSGAAEAAAASSRRSRTTTGRGA